MKIGIAVRTVEEIPRIDLDDIRHVSPNPLSGNERKDVAKNNSFNLRGLYTNGLTRI